jgi:beta-lactamase class A
VTKKAVGRGHLSVAQLCEATMTTSDNTAALLLLRTQGGPAGLTRWLRAHGDTQTRLDRSEPDLNVADPTGAWDTTTPAAMADTVQRLCLGAGLPSTAQAQLQAWMKASTTGAQRLRAGLPTGWQIGDKTGTGDGISNDVAIVWPPGQAAPWVVVAFLSDCHSPRECSRPAWPRWAACCRTGSRPDDQARRIGMKKAPEGPSCRSGRAWPPCPRRRHQRWASGLTSRLAEPTKS